ncbi:MAG: copper resistance protein CopC [Actinomycetota bacterium]|nr:copper resistance protein CopC [Actinomycetota bacterium]
MRRALAAVVLGALVLPGAAFGHAALIDTSPSFRQRLERSPGSVTLRFDQAVRAIPKAIEVRTEHGRLVSGRARGRADGSRLTAPLKPKLARGAYTVRWQALSEDGHVVSGVFTFGVRATAPPPTEAFGAAGPSIKEHVVRWAYFLALALVIGGLGFRLLVLRRPLPPRAERRFFIVVGVGVVATLEAGIAAFLLRAEDALQLPFGRLLYGDLSSLAGHTRFGTAFVVMTLGYALVATIVYLAWLLDRSTLLWPAFLLALGLASGLSLSGHSAVDAGSSWKTQLADWAHLGAAALWVGGLVQLAVVVWPAAAELRRDAFLSFARFAPVLIGVLVCAGVYLSIVRLPHLSDLWEQGYGRVLLVKLGLVVVALAWGAAHHFLFRPALQRGVGGPLVVRLSRSLVGESAVAAAILLAAAVLVDSKPPPQPERGTPPTVALKR